MLEELKSRILNDDISVSSILRNFLVMAKKLDNEEVYQWVLKELQGYESTDELPSYRRFAVESFGYFSNGLKEYPNLPIAPHNVPQELQHICCYADILESIPEIETLIKAGDNSDKGIFTSNWPADCLGFLKDIYDGYVCLKAWRLIPKSKMYGIIDSVKNKSLQIIIEMIENGIKINKETAVTTEQREEFGNIFKTIIYGNIGALQVGESNQIMGNISIEVGDIEKMKRFLLEAGIDKEAISRFSEAIEDDGGNVGVNVKRWLGDVRDKVVSGAIKLTGQVTFQVLCSVILKTLGVPC